MWLVTQAGLLSEVFTGLPRRPVLVSLSSYSQTGLVLQVHGSVTAEARIAADWDGGDASLRECGNLARRLAWRVSKNSEARLGLPVSWVGAISSIFSLCRSARAIPAGKPRILPGCPLHKQQPCQ